MTDYEKVFQLAKNILTDDKKMMLLTQDLEQKLKQLEGSFLDDGIDEVKSYINTLTAKLKDSQDAFMSIATDLNTYGLLLKKGKTG